MTKTTYKGKCLFGFIISEVYRVLDGGAKAWWQEQLRTQSISMKHVALCIVGGIVALKPESPPAVMHIYQ